MSDPWLHILGTFAAFLGFATLEDARRGRRLRPLTFFWSGLALYLVYANELTPTLDPIDGETVAAIGLLFCASSPVISWVWWGQHGRIRRRLLRFVGFVVLLVVSFVVWTLILGPVAETAILAVLTAGLPILPIRQTLRRWHSKLASRRHRRRQDWAAQEQTASDERERQREQAELDRLRRRESELAREVESRDRTLARLEGALFLGKYLIIKLQHAAYVDRRTSGSGPTTCTSSQPPFNTPEGQLLLRTVTANSRVKILFRLDRPDAERLAPELFELSQQRPNFTAVDSTAGDSRQETRSVSRGEEQSTSSGQSSSRTTRFGTRRTDTDWSVTSSDSRGDSIGSSSSHGRSSSQQESHGQTTGSSRSTTERTVVYRL